MIAKVVLQIKASFPADTLQSGFSGETSESRASEVIMAASGYRLGLRLHRRACPGTTLNRVTVGNTAGLTPAQANGTLSIAANKTFAIRFRAAKK